MHLKLILATIQLILVAVSVVAYAYSVYALYADTTTATGQAHVTKHKMLFAGQLVIQVVQLVVASLHVYMA